MLWAVPLHGQPVRILAFGDSITRGFGDTNVDCEIGEARGYPPRVESLLAGVGTDVDFVNAGICGEQTAAGLSRIEDELIASDSDIVVIMEGTNDVSGFVSLESMLFNVGAMADRAELLDVRPVMLSVIPRGPGAGLDESNAKTGAFALQLREQSLSRNRTFGDPFGDFIDLANLFEIFYGVDDPFHPNAIGYNRLASIIRIPIESAISRLDEPIVIVTPPLTCDGIEPEPQPPCAADETTLCLNDERFRLDVTWRDFQDETGTGQAVSVGPDTGTFWFFNEANTELIVKVLDGQNANGYFWVFYGALSNVAYTLRVVDTVTGDCKIYDNPLGTFASVGDVKAFLPPEPDPAAAVAHASRPEARFSPGSVSNKGVVPATCPEDGETLCLNEERFHVRVTWRDFQGNEGSGTPIQLSPDTGYFWFFRDTNVELVIKVLDGRPVNGNYWVFYGALSNVEYTVEVMNTETDKVATYVNLSGAFASVGDTMAFSGEP